MENIMYSNGTSIVTQCMKETIVKTITELLSMFYIICPSHSIKDNPYDVPDYEVLLIPYISLFVVIEAIVRYFQSKEMIRFADVVVNSGSAILFTMMRVFLLTGSIIIMVWLNTHYRLVDLPLHSVWTWLFSLLLVEFAYYWVHRALHELNILWAAHQFHHMAEDVNITTTIRDSVVDLFVYAVFPLPLALIIPPQIILVHVQFSLIYQVWLHNQVIGSLGPIEYLINTPRQHRVHHGKNPYCIDKNYGALIMVWDRLFGTHQTETEPIVYGVVSTTPNTFDSMTLQFGYYRDVWNKLRSMEGIGNKLSALFKGPGWQPGKPRLGLISEIPEPDPSAPKYSYDPYIPEWKKWYIGLHGVIVLIGFYLIADHPYVKFSPEKGFAAVVYVITLLTSFGTIFDNRKYAPLVEIARCLAYFPFDYYLIESVDWKLGSNVNFLFQFMVWVIRLIHVLSINFWLLYMAISGCKCRADYHGLSKGMVKDLEMHKSSNVRFSSCYVFWLISSLSLVAIIFVMSAMARVDSCHQMVEQFQSNF